MIPSMNSNNWKERRGGGTYMKKGEHMKKVEIMKKGNI